MSRDPITNNGCKLSHLQIETAIIPRCKAKRILIEAKLSACSVLIWFDLRRPAFVPRCESVPRTQSNPFRSLPAANRHRAIAQDCAPDSIQVRGWKYLSR